MIQIVLKIRVSTLNNKNNNKSIFEKKKLLKISDKY